ncbi:ATPase [Methanomicrobiaceae archaeon CYW5]|uniref:ABC-ATPase domain-containing protein n=1 Tax=Methanovulcanius yangii TaxID=1789227 RepID=UPI0029CA9ABC|nr:ABC-ATPase domain-containing protein [Methanovulcanius yangii]MBT8507717.1 ATPase [Methanovulcanius yangii]
MQSEGDLRSILSRIDGRGYGAYKDIRGVYRGAEYTLCIDHVQGDPFAAPSRVRVMISPETAGFPAAFFRGASRTIALADYLTRRFADACVGRSGHGKGSGKSGIIAIDAPGQEVLDRTSVIIRDGRVEARFVVGLPAFGRRIAGRVAEDIFFREIPAIVKRSLFFSAHDPEDICLHCDVCEDADALRSQLSGRGLVAFVADGAILPRRSGIDDRRMDDGKVVSFSSPPSMRVTLETPNRGRISGMGIRRGVTLIVGGGYHGKSTLLNAMERGVYNHVPGDGREYVVTDADAVKIRSEDGRRIEGVDISAFIGILPLGRTTTAFRTEDASGSTSQAANIIEAMESGARVLLIDEDTSATNFMIRDHRMQEMVVKEKEPITPFIDKVGQLYREYGISTILVIGGSGDYFDVADTVVCMDEYVPEERTQEARSIADRHRNGRRPEGGLSFGRPGRRYPDGGSISPRKGRREVKIAVRDRSAIEFGVYSIDLSSAEQLVSSSQTRAVGAALWYAVRYMDGEHTVCEVVRAVMDDIAAGGLDSLSPGSPGNMALFRPHELAMAMNRLRTLKVHTGHPSGRGDWR